MKINRHIQRSVGKRGLPAPAVLRSILKAACALEKGRLRKLGLTPGGRQNKALAVDVVFTDAPSIRRLHRNFFGTGSLTDVISFPFVDEVKRTGRGSIGEIYICVPVAKANARMYGEKAVIELARLVIHGFLHLLGYRDDTTRDHKRMWERQELVLTTWACSKKK